MTILAKRDYTAPMSPQDKSPLDTLRRFVAEAGSAERAAKKLGFSGASAITRYLTGERIISASLAHKLGWEKTWRYVGVLPISSSGGLTGEQAAQAQRPHIVEQKFERAK